MLRVRLGERGRIGALVVAIVAFMAYVVARRIPLGFSLGDEGIYFSSASRYTLGDRPFIDDVFNVFRSFDIVQAFFMAILPIDSVLGWRWFGFLVQLLFALSLIPLLRRLLPLEVWIVPLLAIALFTPFNLWTISYNSLGLGCTAVGIALLGAALISNRRIYSVAGGMTFALTALVYTPLLAASAFVIVDAAFRYRDPERRRLLLIWLGSAAAGVAGIVVILVLAGYSSAYLDAVHDLRSLSYYESFSGTRLYRKIAGAGVWPELPIAVLAHLALGYVAAASRTRWPRIAAFTLIAADLLYWIVRYAGDPAYEYPHLMPISVFNAALVATSVGAALPNAARLMRDRAGTAALHFMLAGILASAIPAYVAAANLNQLYIGAEMVWPAAVLVLWMGLKDERERKIATTAAGWLIVLCALVHLHGWTYEDATTSSALSAHFDSEKLRGIRSTARNVTEIDAVVAYIRPQIEDCDFILDYGSPGITYLTDTRPALKASILEATVPPDPMATKWLREMEARKRIPRWAVTGIPLRHGRPIDEYIRTNYRAMAHNGPYTVWRRSSPPHQECVPRRPSGNR